MKQKDPTKKAQIVYLSHGGGPLPILGDPSHKAMVDFIRSQRWIHMFSIFVPIPPVAQLGGSFYF
jgi:hypothetical protein